MTEWSKIFGKTNVHLREIKSSQNWDPTYKQYRCSRNQALVTKLKGLVVHSEQDKMLNSLLDQPYNKVKIDRVLDQKEKNLLTHAIEVKNKTQEWINECIYKKLNGIIVKEE
ncbi:2649_t:CDS:2, partial [Gigaspora margarita]